MTATSLRVVVAAHYASERLGGEAAIPLRLVDGLRARGVDAWLVAHDSDRAELVERFADCPDRLVLVPSLPGGGRLFRWGETLPDGPRNLAWALTQLERQYAMAPVIRRLVRRCAIDVVHQPIGIGPGVPSPLTRLGAPLVVGPLNGGLSMPPGFAERDSPLARTVQRARRPVGRVAHQLVRGKLQAAAVLVANERSRDQLPRRAAARAVPMPESAVQLADWPAKDYSVPVGPRVRFVYLGRLVAYKSPDLLVESFAQVVAAVDAHLEIVGDGPMRAVLERQVADLGLADRVTFTGFVTKPEAAQRLRAGDVYVLPTLREPGGTSVLEAMASALPSVVTDWGGPAEYIDAATGIRVGVGSRGAFVGAFARAMIELAGDPRRRAAMGLAARAKVAAEYDWAVLVDRLIPLYERVARSSCVR